jgi:hypothetical protein
LNPTNFEAQDGPEFDVFDKDAGTHKDHVTIEPSHYQDLEVSYDEELDNGVQRPASEFGVEQGDPTDMTLTYHLHNRPYPLTRYRYENTFG